MGITLYHGTNRQSAIRICDGNIDVRYNKYRKLDFGPGFYTTDDINRARAWALRKANTRNDLPALVVVEFDDTQAQDDDIIKAFQDDLTWGQFIINNRNGYGYIQKISNKLNNLDQNFDITYGRVSDVEVTDVADTLLKEGTELKDLSGILNPNYPFQYVFHTENSLNYIKKKYWRPA